MHPEDEIAEMLDLIDIDRLGGIDGRWVEQGKPAKKKKHKILRSDAEVILEDMILTKKSKILLIETPKAKVKTSRSGVTVEHVTDSITKMGTKKALRFIERFLIPMVGIDKGIPSDDDEAPYGLHLFLDVLEGRHEVGISWATGKTKFGGTVTVQLDGDDAGKKKKGSRSIILIDERSADWKAVPDLSSMPDIGLLHELVHAWYGQRGRNDEMTEREARIVENRYRHERGATSQRELP